MGFFTCHVSLCLLEPTGNLQIIETQFHNTLIPTRSKTANLHALFKLTVWTFEEGHLERRCPITTFSENKILTFFCIRDINNIHQFEDCFLRGHWVSSNGLKGFSGRIVEYLNFIAKISLSAKKLCSLLF